MRWLLARTFLGSAFLFMQLALVSPLRAQGVRIEEVGKSPVEAKFHTDGRVRMNLCPGGIEIVGVEDHVLRVSYPSGDDVKVRIDASDDRADIKLSGCPHNNFKAKIEIPKSTALYIRMMAGQLDIREVTGDKDVELSFGQLNVDIGKRDQYAHVDASVNTGQVEAAAFNISKGGLFRSFDQSGPGTREASAARACGSRPGGITVIKRIELDVLCALRGLSSRS
jgi:hypothetical protein